MASQPASNIHLRQSIPDDVCSIRQVQKITWLATYPNIELGITVADIASKFIDDSTHAGRQKIDARKSGYLDPDWHSWVVEDGQKIIGFCIASTQNIQSRLVALYVLPNYHGNGHGKNLILTALAWLGNNRDVFVNVASYNHQAISFYKKYGFVATGNDGILDTASKLPTGKMIPEIEMIKTTSINQISL